MGEFIDECFEGVYDNFLMAYPDRLEWNRGKTEKVLGSTAEIAKHHFSKTFNFIGYAAALPVAATVDLTKYIASKFYSEKEVSSVLPTPKDEIDIGAKHMGFADSLFQTSGLGTKNCPTLIKGKPLPGKCDWQLMPENFTPLADDFIQKREQLGTTKVPITGTTEQSNFNDFFLDVLGNPDPFIRMLKEAGSTAYRFSLERSVIEPEKGKYNENAIRLYKNFIAKLKDAGIESYMTLCHFVHPKWFLETGGFENDRNVDNYVSYCIDIMQRFSEVEHIMTFNELGVDVVQKYILGAYPPRLKGQFLRAANVMRNMIIAHCKIYKKAKETDSLKDVKVFYTHQFLKFKSLEGGPIEKITAFFFSNLFNNSLYNFFLTGEFSFKVPFVANVEFSVPKEEMHKYGRFMDLVGVQFYGFPRLKSGWNWGREYPGFGNQNYCLWKMGFSFGSSCPDVPDAAVMRFGIGHYPGSIQEDYEEVFANALELAKPVLGDGPIKKIVVSETGRDASNMITGEREELAFRATDLSKERGDQAQEKGFLEILQVMHKYREHLYGFFAWTAVRDHLEWENGHKPCLGTIYIKKDENRQLSGWKFSRAATLLKEVYQNQRVEKYEGKQSA